MTEFNPEAREAERRAWRVDPDAPSDRLDRLLVGAFADLSRSRLQALIREGHVTVDGLPVTAPSAKIAAGSELSLTIPPAAPAEPRPESIALDIVYEDEALIVIDKPAGLVVHPGAGHENGTLVNALIAHCGQSLSGIGGVGRPGIVHRLDKDTSGLLVVAKTDAAHRNLSAQFADHGRTGSLERAYLAIVWGVPSPARGVAEGDIARDPRSRDKMAVVPAGRGRHARTHYALQKVLGPGDRPVASLVRCELETGRTHQIRVHMAKIGHPLLGDPLYGTSFKTKANRLSPKAQAALAHLDRQALHAALLGFEHPTTRQALLFESSPPDDYNDLLTALSAES